MASTRLIVIRGNSGAGKTSVALELRRRYGRGLAWVSQDLLRRQVLREQDRHGAANIGLIDTVARYSLAQGYHVVLDGILAARRYEAMLAALRREHDGHSFFYYLQATLAATLDRHETRPMRAEVSPDQLRSWYLPGDLLTSVPERVIPQTSSLTQTVETILAETRLLAADVAIPRVIPATAGDLPSWLGLVAEVEPLFGPMPDFAEHASRGIARGTALVVLNREDRVTGAALLSGSGRHIRWLAVRAASRRRGVGRALLAEILRRWPPPGDVDVETFGPDVIAGRPARALYESFGFRAGRMLAAGPEGGSRQEFVLTQP